MYSKTVFVFLVVYILFDFSNGHNNQVSFRDDYTYIEAVGSFYKFHTTKKNWRDAKRECDLEGASLFYSENNDEANAVISFWTLYQNNNLRRNTWMYVGISDIITEGVYETIDGKSISDVYIRWGLNQPDNRGNEDCLHMNQEGYFNDIKCDVENYFTCKKTLPSLERNCSCNNPQPDIDGQRDKAFFRKDYTYIESQQSFYKVHTTEKNWRDAKRECNLEGASLFYAENNNEANAVISFWTNTLPSITWVYVGISDIITEGVYETIDGKSMSDVYNSWKFDQPDNSGDEDCLQLNQEGKFNDMKCNAKHSFICQKTLRSLERNCSCNNQQPNLYRQRDKTFFRKDYTYIESELSFYKVHTTAKNFADAKRMCALEGASLFYAENEDEVNAVVSFWNRTQPNIPWVFVGLSDIMVEGFFETLDRRPITEVFNRWQKNQPDNFGDKEDCVHMGIWATLNDYQCDTKSYFICKKSLQSLQWNYDCNIPYLDYKLNKNTGKCYKLHTTPLNWTEAYAMCRIEYTSLAVISNRMEADHLVNLTKSTPKTFINEQYQRGIYHLGFHNRFNEGWMTVKGTPMKVDADVWFENNPPGRNHYEECGSMFFDGRLINTDCNTKSMFICEHEVDGSNENLS